MDELQENLHSPDVDDDCLSMASTISSAKSDNGNDISKIDIENNTSKLQNSKSEAVNKSAETTLQLEHEISFMGDVNQGILEFQHWNHQWCVQVHW